MGEFPDQTHSIVSLSQGETVSRVSLWFYSRESSGRMNWNWERERDFNFWSDLLCSRLLVCFELRVQEITASCMSFVSSPRVWRGARVAVLAVLWADLTKGSSDIHSNMGILIKTIDISYFWSLSLRFVSCGIREEVRMELLVCGNKGDIFSLSLALNTCKSPVHLSATQSIDPSSTHLCLVVGHLTHFWDLVIRVQKSANAL